MFDKISVLDPGHFEVDPDLWICTLDYGTDPALFVSGFQDANKKYVFKKVFFAYYVF